MKNLFCIFLTITLGIVGCTTNNKKGGAEWTTLRANNNRDGRIVSTGEFANSASLSQSVDYSTSEGYIELSPSGKNSAVEYSKDELNEEGLRDSLSFDWQTGTDAYLDLYGDGKIRRVSISQAVKYAQLFKGDNKYYRIEAIDGYSVARDANKDIFMGIRIYEGNTNRLIVEKRFPQQQSIIRPQVNVADMDNDGRSDIIITCWEGIFVFNNKGEYQVGIKESVAGWHHLRKRGFTCVRDIDGNGYKDVIIISSLPWHVDVIKNERGVLKFGWTKIFDGLVESAKKLSRPVLNSVNDFDADGTFEILVNVYNYEDEHNWSCILFDAVTGKPKAQMKGVYVVSAEDLNNDGKYLFFCAETKEQSVPIVTALKTVSFKNGAMTELLSIDKGEWINPRIANTSPIITTHNDGISRLAENQVLCVDFENKGQKAFFLKTPNQDGSSVIKGYYLSKDGTVKRTDLEIEVPSGMYGELLRGRQRSNGKHSLLLQVKAFASPGGTISIKGAETKNLGRYVSLNTKAYIPVVADINSDGSAEILIPNDAGEVLCFSQDSKGTFTLSWKVPGRGMLWQYSAFVDYGVSVEDVNHDGYKEVLVSGSNEVGAVIFVYDHKGKLLWEKGFPEINAGDIISFDGNIAFFGSAQSSKRKNRDIIVTVQRGIAHSGKTYCLEGTDGSVIWELDTLVANYGRNQRIVSGAGGNVFSTYDIDADGSDEVMCGYGNIVFFANSNDGTIKFKQFMRKVFTDEYDYPAKGYTTFWIQQILPVAFQNSGQIALSCFNTSVSAGTMNTKGSLNWCPEDLEYTDRNWQCMANLDGDGKLWVVEVSTRMSDDAQVMFAYDPANGAQHKTFSVELPSIVDKNRSGAMPAACDLNGDGRDEIILSNDTGVYCYGYKDQKLSVLWKYLTPGCGPAVIADTDSDGFVEVVVATQGGKVLVIDK